MKQESSLIRYVNKQSVCANLIGAGESLVSVNFLKEARVIFDVGGHVGDWSKCAMYTAPTASYHIFEADPQTFDKLRANLADRDKATTHLVSIACADTNSTLQFFRYSIPSLNTAHRRVSVENSNGLGTPETIAVPCITLDSYCTDKGISKINFLKIDTEGAELSVLKGARSLLSLGAIDMLQFEYGGTFQDAGTRLEDAFTLLHNYGYDLYKITDDGLMYFPSFENHLEDYEYSNYFCSLSSFRSQIHGA